MGRLRRQEIDIENLGGADLEVPRVVTVRLLSVEKVLIAPLALPCARHLLSPLRERYVSYLQHTAV